MRYREGQDIDNLQPDLSDGVTDFTVALTLVIAIILIAMGRFGRQRWLVFWGVMTVFAVIAYVVIRWFDLL